jgi:pyrimidine-nucleoside phosphorylase
MRAVDLIRHKRDGGTLDRAQIDFFVGGVTDGSLPDYQAAALLMAIVLKGMTREETVALTEAMIASGVRVTYPNLPGVAVDKHSTGGVGDKASLVLAPLVAACGAPVPMMSGRGLGHTGGTLDKLESIPGFRTALTLDELQEAVSKVGCALLGQTADIAPADRRLYALRDVTGTVESIPLISASIMSKKVAEGIGGLVLDVKTGSGAFMKTRDASRALAESLVAIGQAFGVETEALITRMSSPLGRTIGNSLEVIEAVETLKGRGPSDVEDLSVALAARMLIVSRLEADEARAEARLREALASGAGLEKLREVVEFQGGDPRALDDYSRLPAAPGREMVRASRAGFVGTLEAEAIGRAGVALGAGRARLGDPVDHGVGIEVVAPPGAAVSAGDAVLIVHHRRGRGLDEALPLLTGGVHIVEQPAPPEPLVLERILHG